ncbi:MAG: recombinase RecT, partial [Spirochaetia bacterium]|nr:recombinase RecT [Spirochaetia bacterium]
MSTNQARTVNQQGLITKQTQAVAKKKEPQTLKDFVIAMQDQIAKALPSVITAERFTRIALTALSSNPKLAECDRNSFLGGLMQAAQLGLEPNTPLGQAYLIPFRNKKKGITECQFQIGYK